MGWGIGAVILVGVTVGALTRLAFGATEAAANNVENDYSSDDANKDISRGAVIGFFSAIAKTLKVKVNGPFKKLIVNQTAKNSIGASKKVAIASALAGFMGARLYGAMSDKTDDNDKKSEDINK